MTIWVYSGRPSKGAHLLCEGSDFKRMKYGKYWEPGDVVINWGAGNGPPYGNIMVNDPEAICIAVNKKRTFQVLTGSNIATVPWTANKAVAKEWLDAGEVVVCRTILTGYEGDGIILVKKGEALPDAPLYTKYIWKVREFRVHATRHQVIETQWKIRDPEQEPKCWKIRTEANGFLFQRKNIAPSAERDTLAVQTVIAIGLDFAGLDIIEDEQGKFYVLEVNTAPGIDGTDIPTYVKALTQLAAEALAA